MIYIIKNRFFSSNTYLLTSEIDNSCIIIDPGLDYTMIDEKIKINNLNPIAIICTHGHFDHIGSAAFFKNKFQIPFYLHEADLKLCLSANFYLKIARVNHKIETPTPDFLFKGNYEHLRINQFDLNVYNLPGHSYGSCILKNENYLFSGDIIYKKGLGPGSIPRENETLLRQSILKMFDMFMDEDLVLPGHGPKEQLGRIKQNNLELKNFISNKTDANA